MALTAGKKILAAGVVLAALLAGGVHIANTRMQETAVEGARRVLAAVPAPHSLGAESVHAGLFGREVTLRGLHGVFVSADGNYGLRAREAVVEGPAYNGGKGEDLRLAKALVLREVAIQGPGYEEKTAEYRLEDLRGDLPRLVAAWQKLPPGMFSDKAERPDSAESQDEAAAPKMTIKGKEELRALSEFLLAAETLYAGSILNRDSVVVQVMDGSRVTVHEAQGDWRQVSLRRTGPLSAQGVRVRIDGQDFCAVERVSMEGMAFPGFGAIMARSAAKAADEEDWREILKGESFTLKNLRLERFSAADSGMVLKSLTALSFTVNGTVSEEKAFSLSASCRYEGLVLNAEALNSLVQDTAGVKGPFPPTLELGGDWTFSLGGKKRAGVIDVFRKQTNLHIKDLADVSGAVELEDLDLSSTGDAARLKDFALKLTDLKGSELFFAALAEEEGTDPRAARESLACELEKQAQSAPPALQTALAAGVSFVRTPGGTLNLALRPQKPLALREALMLLVLSPEQMGLSATFTPGGGAK